MSTLTNRTIAALRTSHDELAALVQQLGDEQLTGPSGASEWSAAQVLSHLGSGAEISKAGHEAMLAGDDAPDQAFNESVWNRWNALTPQQQASRFVESDSDLVARLEALTEEQRESLEVKLGFLPSPIAIGTVAGLRLNEVALHGWDVKVALDAEATVSADAVEVLAEQYAGGLGFMLGFAGKADALREPATIAIADTGFSIVIADGVSLAASEAGATATFSGELEAALRLIAGRLTNRHTPPGVEVSGNVTLDELRRVFPGY